MEKYPHIIKALSICSDYNTTCSDCPYKEKSRERIGRTCKQALYHDAMEALAAEETRADNLQERADDLREETEMLAAENAKLREELKNRPEVGFDANTFDACLAKINEKTGAAKYWRGFADGLKWCFHEYFKDNRSCTELSEALMRKKMEEAGDDV